MGLETEYFHKKEQELIDQLRKRQDRLKERQELSEALGVEDQEILSILHEMGYTRDTVQVLHLVPLIQTAWASGSVTPGEREMVLRLSEWRGVTPESAAWRQLTAWLDERPTDEFFLQTLRIIRRLFDSQTTQQRVAGRTDLISFCIRIANTSGGFLGVGSKISDGEKMALEQIVHELTRRNPGAIEQVINQAPE